jgi:predicted lipid-binding transport protein (Tim44 family)
MKLWTAILAATLAFAALDADARRLGGGKSVGRQSSNVTQREAAPPTAPANAQQQAQARQQQPGAPAPAQAAPRRPWGGMLGGLAAGLGLAWLAHALGFGEGFAQVLLLLLLGVVAMAVIGAVMRARRAAPTRGGFAWQGAGSGPEAPAAAPQYNPDKVGNDASARPWERSSMAFDAAKHGQAGQMGVRIGSGLSGSQAWGVPEGFDAGGFVTAAKRHFVTLQDAWDRGDLTTLKSMMTDGMLAEIRDQLAAREAEGGRAGRTDVVMLQANLLGIEELPDEYLASVEFSGMIREEPSAGPSPFREVWNMTKPRHGAGGWLVAGVQALQ